MGDSSQSGQPSTNGGGTRQRVSESGDVVPSSANMKTQQYRRVGDYEVLQKLGAGAMGAVYMAKKISNDERVAIKILPPDLAKDAELLERFKREARAAQKLTHPNIVAALDVGFFDRYHYIAMEYVDGSDLETQLNVKSRFNDEEVLKIASDMALALQAAEGAGIVHRDIKPANILMTKNGVCKLADMGLASASSGDQRVTMAGFAVGTPYYISPEQARGEYTVDGRADIYCLGATLYHLATGTVPFPGTNPVTIMTQHLNEPAAPPHERQPQVGKPISFLIQKMMAKETTGRHQNARELMDDIERCKRGEIPILKVAAAPRRASTASKDSGTLDQLLHFVPKEWRVPFAAAMGVLLVIGIMLIVVGKLLRG